MGVVGADRTTMEFGDDFGARTLNDRDPSEQRRTKGQRQDRSVPRRNYCSRRRNKAIESRDDETEDLWRLDPMIGIDWFRIAPDQQEPEQVNWGRPGLNAPLGVVVEQTLPLEHFFPRSERWWVILA